MAFLFDDKQLASDSDDKTIRLWNAATGATLQTLESHSNSVRTVVFSPDDKQLASGSDNKIIRL